MQPTTNTEISFIQELTAGFPRHELQLNDLFEADAEIIDFKNLNPEYLVVKTDSIQEEIREKLYEDPYIIGWMAVTATISDIAAVGAKPLGLLLTLQLPEEYNKEWMNSFVKGIKNACSLYEVSVLGGDTGFGPAFTVSSTGIGMVNKGRPLLRKSIKIGEFLYATGPLGIGNAFAYSCFFDPGINVNYQPVARLIESKLVRHYATACIDTSDGLFPALSVLAQLNHVGVKINTPLQELLDSNTLEVRNFSGLPSWMFLAGPHGEYELLFSIPLMAKDKFENDCRASGWKPVLIGEFIEEELIQFTSEKMYVNCHPATIPNLFRKAGGNIQFYFEMLKKQHQYWLKQ